MGQACSICLKTLIVCQLNYTKYLTKPSELAIITHSNDKMPVFDLERLVRGNILMSITITFGRFARGHVVQVLVSQHGNLRIQQGNIQILPQSAAVTLLQRA